MSSAVSLLLVLLISATGHSCSDRLYLGKSLNTTEYLCSGNLLYYMRFNATGHVIVTEALTEENPYTATEVLFATDRGHHSPKSLTLTPNGDLKAVATDGTVYWRANVTGSDYLELQNSGRAVLLKTSTSITQILWQSPSNYSHRRNPARGERRTIVTEVVQDCAVSGRDMCRKKSSVALSSDVIVTYPGCLKKLRPNELLLPSEQLCSSNKKHTLTVGSDGRLLLDGNKWTSGSANGQTAYLHYTSNNELLLRRSDGVTAWSVDLSNGSYGLPGYLTVSNHGRVVVYNSLGYRIWTNEHGPRVFVKHVIRSLSKPTPEIITDHNIATCAAGIASAYTEFRFDAIEYNTIFFVTLAGHTLHCGYAGYFFATSHEGLKEQQLPEGRFRGCKLLSAGMTECRFECECKMDTCDVMSLWQLPGEAISPYSGHVCEVLMR